MQKILIGPSGIGKTQYIIDNKSTFDKLGTVIICASRNEYKDFNKANVIEVNDSSHVSMTTQSLNLIHSDIKNIKLLIVDEFESINKIATCFNDIILDLLEVKNVKVLITSQRLDFLFDLFGKRCRHKILFYDFHKIFQIDSNLQMIDIEDLGYKHLDKINSIKSIAI